MKITVEETPGALKFKEIVVRKPITSDYVAAQMMLGPGAGQMALFQAVLAVCGIFDGEKKTYEDLNKMDGWDFFELLGSISPKTAEEWQKQFSSSQKTEISR